MKSSSPWQSKSVRFFYDPRHHFAHSSIGRNKETKQMLNAYQENRHCWETSPPFCVPKTAYCKRPHCPGIFWDKALPILPHYSHKTSWWLLCLPASMKLQLAFIPPFEHSTYGYNLNKIVSLIAWSILSFTWSSKFCYIGLVWISLQLRKQNSATCPKTAP